VGYILSPSGVTGPFGFRATKEVFDIAMIHRERKIPLKGVDGKGKLTVTYKDHWLGIVNKDEYLNDSTAFLDSCLGGYQITDTESHPLWRRHKSGVYRGDIGGPFSTLKWWTEVSQPLTHLNTTRVWDYSPDGSFPRYSVSNKYRGIYLPYYPYYLQYPNPMPSRSSDDDLDELGTKAIAMVSPSNPTVDLTTAIGETVKEGIPKLIGGTLRSWRGLSNRDRRRAIGHEYLNVEFGWKPLIADLTDLAKSIIHADKILTSYERNSGKLVRRGYDFPVETSHDVQVAFPYASPWFAPSNADMGIPGFSDYGKVYRTDEVTVRRWFRGAFSYYVPPPTGLRNNIARQVIQARKLLGISLTPDSLWNLAPWSWAVDWFVDVGDVLSNWTDWAIDNQVLMYGYIMEHKRHERTYTFAGHTGLRDNQQPGDVRMIVESKVRRPATPYGFGLQWTDLSDRQKTIIAALGISRSR
jgi:hypothetical protein